MVNKEAQFGEGGVLLPSEFFLILPMGKLMLPIGLLQFAALRPLLVWKSGGRVHRTIIIYFTYLLTYFILLTGRSSISRWTYSWKTAGYTSRRRCCHRPSELPVGPARPRSKHRRFVMSPMKY